ncbi:SGNH/GDSL hydrolase family protein [uncultured Ferrimonas sp.]|uniref:SGNH/GDSL hydrolase family protein n=1 Tax=uncultured Ferrimonas sp. TaxID=432640 RepID=UPI00260C56C8|nr:SGNH/GDSL hydrolase family protein [uncultured Ferrimonas sp.]
MADIPTLILSPLLLIQGKWLRWRLPKLDEAAGPRQGEQGDGQPLSLLVFGDSAAAGVGVAQQQQALAGQLSLALSAHYQLRWHLHAQSGLTTAQADPFIKGLPTQQADVVVISLGVNDVKSTGSAQRWLLELDAVVSRLRAELKPQLILIAELPPMGQFPKFPQPLRAWLGWRANQFNQHLHQWAQQQPLVQLTSIPKEQADLAVDGLHPGQGTYRLWAQRVQQQIRSALTVQRAP